MGYRQCLNPATMWSPLIFYLTGARPRYGVVGSFPIMSIAPSNEWAANNSAIFKASTSGKGPVLFENGVLRFSACGGSDQLGRVRFAHGGAGLAEMAAWLTSVAGAEASAIHVAIETPHGPIVETLLEHGFSNNGTGQRHISRHHFARHRSPGEYERSDKHD